MKLYFTVFLIINLFYLVQKCDCGVIDNVYGTVEHGRQTVKDAVNNWWDFGKGMLFGKDEDAKVNTNVNNTINEPDHGIIGGAYDRLVNGYRAARRKIHDFFVEDKNKGSTENNERRGIIKSTYERVGKKVSQLKSFVFGNIEKASNTTNDAQEEIKNNVYNFLKQQNIKKNGLASFNSVSDQIKESYGAVTENLNKFEIDARNRVNSGVNRTNDYVSDNVKSAKETYSNTIEDILQNANDLSEREKEVLNSISSKLRNRVANTYDFLKNSTEDIKQLSYSGSV